MKISIKTLAIALMAMLSLSSCLSDNDDEGNKYEVVTDPALTKSQFFGRWNVRLSGKPAVEDSSVWYTFSQDGTFRKELYDALSEPGQQNFVTEGTWNFIIGKDAAVLTITTQETNAGNGHTDEYSIVRFRGNSFTATVGGTSYDFTKIIYE